MKHFISDEHYKDESMFKRDFELADRKTMPHLKLESMFCERKIRQNLEQIDRMLDKINSTTDEQVIEACKRSIERAYNFLVEAEYYPAKISS
jgi:hypothetical protein